MHIIRLFLLPSLLLSLLFSGLTQALTQSFTYPVDELDDKITSPENFLGYPLGEWHLRHDQINFYLQQLAQDSERISLEQTGQSHEARQQLTAIITSPANQSKLPDIVAQRAKAKSGEAQQGPLVVWLAYSIHGDEASGAHAALAVSYYLSASKADWVKTLLDNTIVLITPSQNPDGLDRFANWANNNRSYTLNTDNDHREHKQDWPGGRFNHYLADLNRDWLFLRHPESQGRVAFFHKWLPHYVGDFHEMGHEGSYFFQPGVPERTHPLTPELNQQLTNELASFHRQALDDLKQVYFSRQSFDDFFYGKGSTYPDINGSVGMLFEQASARGQAQDTPSGVVTLQKAISNQFATSIASLKGTFALKDKLLRYQADFYDDKSKQNKDGRQSGMLLKSTQDSYRRDQLAQLLSQHQIRFSYLQAEITQGDMAFLPNDSLFIPFQQPQRALLEAMFDKRTEFVDPTFYDISSWDLQYAFDLSLRNNAKPDTADLTQTRPTAQATNWTEQAVALLIDWQQNNAAPLLVQLLQQDIKVKYATKTFSVPSDNKALSFSAGTLQISLMQDQASSKTISDTVRSLALQYRIQVIPVFSAAVASGIDLGSPDFLPIPKIKPMLLAGLGSDPDEVGELWHYVDKTLGSPISLVNTERLNKLSLDKYTHVIFADGNYEHMDDIMARKLGQFVTEGGTIIAQKGALKWLQKRNVLNVDILEDKFYKQLFNTDGYTFKDKEKLKARQSIGGAILGLKLDSSHPLSFGLGDAMLPIMKNKVLGLSQPSDPFAMVAHYQDEPLLSGYLAKEYQRSLANSPAIIVEKRGKGAVVAIADNLLFRNIWLGSEKIYANALFFLPAGIQD